VTPAAQKTATTYVKLSSWKTKHMQRTAMLCFGKAAVADLGHPRRWIASQVYLLQAWWLCMFRPTSLQVLLAELP
jgi:hypothetical protein